MKTTSFQEIANSLTEALLVLSPDGCVVDGNSAASEILSELSVGTNLVERSEEPSRCRRYLTLASRSSLPLPGSLRFKGCKSAWRCDARVARLDGKKMLLVRFRPIEATLSRFSELNQQIAKLQAEIRTRLLLEKEREYLLHRTQEARAAAVEANRFKDELLASISHELRTPLQAISGWLTLIREEPDNRAQLMRGLEVIERNVNAQIQLTEDLVDTSSVLAGRMKLETGIVDLEEVIRHAVESIKPTIFGKQQQIEVQSAAGSYMVDGDQARLLQVFWNLLSNSSKYTPAKGKIQVTLRQVSSRAEVVVSDSGTGIAAEVLPFVFERFRRADQSTTRRHGGLGLGLSIVRQLVELHGGLVLADSDGLGQGSTFTVNLPLAEFRNSCSDAIIDSAAQSDTPVLEDLRVLLVEDNNDSREILCKLLESRGAVVLSASSAVGALRFLAKEGFDIVISDIEMPDEDGFTMMRKLRALERDDKRIAVPAIAVSAHSMGAAREHALRAGFQSFLAKPLNPSELVAEIARLTGLSSRNT